MRFPLDKYKYITHIRKDGVKEIIALSSYAGHYVKGIAKCNPEDNYEPGIGEKIAAARCNLKVTQKRAKNAEKAYAQAAEEYNKAIDRLHKMTNYLTDTRKEVAEAEDFLIKVLKDIK